MRAFERPSFRNLTLYLAVGTTVVVLLAAFHLDLQKSSRIPEDAFGCDWFGYLRQARLFRENGAFAGLDTAIRHERTQYLVRVAKRIGEPLATWDEGVAPMCHHYVPTTDRVILQYPPGTGFLFSFFEEGAQARKGFVVSALIVFAVLLVTTVSARTATVPLLVLAIAGVFMSGLFRFSEEWSVPPTGAILLVAALCTVWVVTAPTLRQNVIRSAILGFVLGLSIDARLLNMFIAAGPFVVLAMNCLRRPSRSAALSLLAAALGLTVGVLPVLAANLINVGHPLSPTYNRVDWSAPVLTWNMLSRALPFYFGQEPLNRMFTVAALLVVPILIQPRRLHDERIAQATIAGAIGFGLCIVMVLTHRVLIPYYVFPAAAFAAATALFSLVASENAGARRQGGSGLPIGVRAVVVAVGLLATVLIMRRQTMPVSPYFSDPASTSTIEPQAIVWGDLGTGNVEYFLHRQAAKLIELDQPLQDRFLAEIAKDGVRQYLLNDSSRMDDIIVRLAKGGRLRKSGRVLDYDLYTIEPPDSQVSESANR
jgi:hypothetical protein